MPSIREQLLENLTAHLRDRLEGWSVQRFADQNELGALPSLILYYAGHRKRLRADGAGEVEYTTELGVILEVTVAFEDADAEQDGGNPLRYLGRMADAAEVELHRVKAYEPPNSELRLDVDSMDIVFDDEQPTTATATTLARFTFNETFEVTV